MNVQAHCIVLTQDSDLHNRLEGFLKLRTKLEFKEARSLKGMPSEIGSTALLLLDLRVWQTSSVLRADLEDRHKRFILLIGSRRSEPALDAVREGISQIIPLDFTRLELQDQIEQIQGHLMTQMQLFTLQASANQSESVARTSLPESQHSQQIATQLTKTLQHLHDIDSFFTETVRIIGQAMAAPRIILVTMSQDSMSFISRAALRSKEGSLPFEIRLDSHVAECLRNQALVITRRNLSQFEAKGIGVELLRVMDKCGIDTIAPLYGRTSLIGWFMIGLKATGKSFSEEELNDLMVMCGDISPILENALHSEKNNLQKSLLENVFQSLPTGLVALDANERVLWLNAPAEHLLGKKFGDLLNASYSEIDHNISAALPNVIAASLDDIPHSVRLKNDNLIEIKVVRYNANLGMPCCLLVIEDATLKEELRREQEKLKRNELLAEISGNISVGIRAPLTAIKTFTQLLPEHMNDHDFCTQFSSVVDEEVKRLHDFTENIATISKLTASDQQVKTVFTLAKCFEMAKCLAGTAWSQVDCQIPANLPTLEGNPDRLSEALYHLIANAADAIADIGNGKILITAKQGLLGKNIRTLEVSVVDNRNVKKVGSFVDNSNLSSEDAIRRADLRLSIVSKITHENAGTLNVQSTDYGVFVKMIFPTAGEAK